MKHVNIHKNTDNNIIYGLRIIEYLIHTELCSNSNEVIQLGQTSVAGKTCGPFGDMKLTEAYGRFRQQCTMNTVNHILKWFVSDSVLVPLFFLLL